MRCGQLIYIFRACEWNGYNVSEFLINFQGGFVRRGLFGELIFQISSFGISPLAIIYTVCIASYLFVLLFFIKKFAYFRLNWWLVLSPFLCGYLSNVIRKDFLTFAIIIFIILLLRKENISLLKCFAATMLCLFGICLHEAFIFYGFPIMALLIIRGNKSKWRYPFLLVVPLAFLLFCHFKGDKTIAFNIIDSWNSIVPGDNLVFRNDNSIGALGWNSVQTFKTHFTENFYSPTFGWVGGILWRLFVLIVTYYFITNFLFVLKGNSNFGKSDRDIISSLYVISIVCLFPLFTVLSCDYARLYQYAFMSTFISYLLVENQVLAKAVGAGFVRKVSTLNDRMAKLIRPKRWIMILLLLFLAEANCYLDFRGQFDNSIVGFIEAKIERMVG